MRKLAAIFLAVLLCLSLCGCGKQKTVEGEGFDSPKDALYSFAHELKDGNIEAMVQTFAVETYLEYYDHDPQALTGMGAYNLVTACLPESNDFARELNLAYRESEVQMYIARTYCISRSSDIDSAEWAEMISGMKITNDFYWPWELDVGSLTYTQEAMEEVAESYCDYYGCDELAMLGLKVEMDGEPYLLTMDIGRYGDRWYNLIPGGYVNRFMHLLGSAGHGLQYASALDAD